MIDDKYIKIEKDFCMKSYQSTCSVVQQVITADMSPIHKGTAMQHLTMEGKKEDWDEDKLKWQLFSNMITAAVLQFLENGIPDTGNGIVRLSNLYKLDSLQKLPWSDVIHKLRPCWWTGFMKYI